MAKKKDAQFNPAAQSLDYQALKEDWQLITTLLGGTRAMREAGTEYLPQHVEESDEQYERGSRRRSWSTPLRRRSTASSRACSPSR